MLPPRAQNYHFAYTVYAQRMLSADTARLSLLMYPAGFAGYANHIWTAFGEGLPPEDRVPGGPLVLSAFQIGGTAAAFVLELPPPERMLEAFFIGMVFLPELRYFILGRAPSLGDDDHLSGATLREVTAEFNARRGGVFDTTIDGFLKAICRVLSLPATIEPIDDAEARQLSNRVPVYPAWSELFGDAKEAADATHSVPAEPSSEPPKSTSPGRPWWKLW